MQAPPEEDVEVRLEDQKKINTFGRLNTRMHELEDDLKAKNGELELLDDAQNELILADDDEPIRYTFGDAYFQVNKDQADELLDAQKDKLGEEIAALQTELAGIRGTLSELKTALYSRFGGNINLEEN